MKRLFLFLVIAVFFFIFLDAFAYYSFLSPESNVALESWGNPKPSKSPASEFGYYYAIISDPDGTTSFLNSVPYEDFLAAPTDLKIGEKWTGPSGITYIAKSPASTEPGAEQINSILDTTLVSVGGGNEINGGDISYQYYYSGGVTIAEITTEVTEADQVSCAEIVDAEIGDQFVGLSGKTYILQEQKILSKDQIQYLTNQDIVVSGVWVPIDDEDEEKEEELEGFNWFGQDIIPAIGNGYYDKYGVYVLTDITSPEINPGNNYTYFQLTLPPDDNIPPGTTFPSIGFYVHN